MRIGCVSGLGYLRADCVSFRVFPLVAKDPLRISKIWYPFTQKHLSTKLYKTKNTSTTEDNQKQPPKQFSKISVLFSRSNLFKILQEGPFVRRTDMNFPGGFIEKTCFFKEVLSDLIIS